MATLLADWDAQSVTAFVAKMNTVAAKLGLSSTHITDPSGVDPATTSSAEDLIRLGEAAISIPVLRQMVSLGQANVPGTAVVYNLNFDLGQDGIVGIKTGSDSSAQGCYLFAAQQSIGFRQVTVVGAILGQPGGSLGPNTTAVDAGDALVKSTFAALHADTVLAPGQNAGEVTAPWGASAPLTVAKPVDVVGWPGLAVTVTAHTQSIKGGLRVPEQRSERSRPGVLLPRSRCTPPARSRDPASGGGSPADTGTADIGRRLRLTASHSPPAMCPLLSLVGRTVRRSFLRGSRNPQL